MTAEAASAIRSRFERRTRPAADRKTPADLAAGWGVYVFNIAGRREKSRGALSKSYLNTCSRFRSIEARFSKSEARFWFTTAEAVVVAVPPLLKVVNVYEGGRPGPFPVASLEYTLNVYVVPAKRFESVKECEVV